jgi:hypothetical protein
MTSTQGTEVDVVVGSVVGVSDGPAGSALLGPAVSVIPKPAVNAPTIRATASGRCTMVPPQSDACVLHSDTRPPPPSVGSPVEVSPLSIEDELPGAVAAVRKTLVRRGVGAEAAEDIAQEVAVRALRQSGFASAEHLRAWCFLVAWRLVTDRWRRQRRHPETDEVPDRPVGSGLDAVVQYRAAAEELLTAIGGLTPKQQRAVGRILLADGGALHDFLGVVSRLSPTARLQLAPVLDVVSASGGSPSSLDPASPTERWERHDVRRRLRGLVENFGVLAARARLRGRSVALRCSDRSRLSLAAVWAGATTMAVSLVVVAAGGQARPADTALAAIGGPLPSPPPSVVSSAPAAPPTVHASDRPAGPPPQVALASPEPSPRQTVVHLSGPSDDASISLVANAAARPLACVRLAPGGGCVDKPEPLRALRPPPG